MLLRLENETCILYLSVLGVTPITSQEEWSSVVNQLPRPSISITAAPEHRSRVKRTSWGGNKSGLRSWKTITSKANKTFFFSLHLNEWNYSCFLVAYQYYYHHESSDSFVCALLTSRLPAGSYVSHTADTTACHPQVNLYCSKIYRSMVKTQFIVVVITY